MNKIVLMIATAAVIISGFSLYNSTRSPKVAYIRSADMIYAYEGMKEAQKIFQDKMQAWQSNLDTLRLELQRNVNSYTQELGRLSVHDKTERQELLNRQQQNYNQYTKAINEKSKDEEQKMTEGVLNQVNSFVEEYSKAKGYDLVIGTTNAGNLLYAREYMDITDDVLKALNENYHSSIAKMN